MCITLHVFQRTRSFSLVRAMFPKSCSPPLPSSDAFSTGQIPVRSTPPPPPPSSSVANVQTHAGGSFPVWLNIVGRLGQYRIEASTADQLAPLMGQLLDAEQQADMQQAMLHFQQTMMMNQALVNSPCYHVHALHGLSVYQPLCINHVGVHKRILLVRNPPHLVRCPCLQSDT